MSRHCLAAVRLCECAVGSLPWKPGPIHRMQCNNPHLSRRCGRPWCCRRHGCNGGQSVRLMRSTPSLTHIPGFCGMSVACSVEVKLEEGRLSPVWCQWRREARRRLAGGSLSVLDRSRTSRMWPRRISPVGPRMSSWPWPPQSARPRRRFVRLLGRCRRSVVYPRARRPDQAPAAAISFLYPQRWPSHPDE
jgi:hypothetical protein